MILKLLFSFLSLSLAKSETDHVAKNILKDMTLTYSRVEYMKSEYKKDQFSELLGEMESSKGTVEFSKGRIRVEESKKKKNRNIFIKNKETFWHLQPDNQVLTGPVSKAVPSVFEMMFSNPNVWDDLGSKVISKKEDIIKIQIMMGEGSPNYSNFFVTINTNKRRFEAISFQDEVGNKTDIVFSKTSFFRKVKEERFSYKPKKSDKVNSI